MALSEEAWERGVEGAAIAKGRRNLVYQFQKTDCEGSISRCQGLGANLECADQNENIAARALACAVQNLLVIGTLFALREVQFGGRTALGAPECASSVAEEVHM